MNITIWTKPKGFFTLILGVIILINPSWFFGLFGLELSAAGDVVGRMYSAAFFPIGLGLLRVKGAENFDSKDALMATLGDTLVFLVLLGAQLMGHMNIFGWILVCTGLSSALGFFWCYLQVKQDPAKYEQTLA